MFNRVHIGVVALVFSGVKGYLCAISVQLSLEVAVLKKDRESQSQLKPTNGTSSTSQTTFGFGFLRLCASRFTDKLEATLSLAVIGFQN